MKNEVLLCWTLLFVGATCSRILIVFPFQGRSHFILANALGKGLAAAGHDVTMISPFEDKQPPKNGTYTNVVLDGLTDEKNRPVIMTKLLHLENMNPFWYIPYVNHLGNDITIKAFSHPKFQEFIKSNQTFDVDMNFWQRLTNWLYLALAELNQHLIFFPAQNKLMHEYFPDAPDLRDILYNSSLFFLNSHESISQAVPQVPNMINIGGFHISPPKGLPKDLKDFLDSAKDGVVYFSMGSNIKPSQISDGQKQVFLRSFSKIKQKVLWKWDEDVIEGKPDKVKLGKWFPQADILAHPNTKLFVTHGGLLSITESIYHGVPLLALPVFADQKMNAARAVLGGYGLTLKFSEITEEKLDDALDTLLKNPSYRENIKKRSHLMKDRPINPMDLAVYWTEFVIRNKGAPHLRVAGLDLSLYKYLLLDVIIAFVMLSIILLTTLIYVAFRKIYRTISKTKDKVKKN